MMETTDCLDVMSEYNTLMSSLQVAVFKHLMDEHYTMIWANDFYYQKCGYTKEEYDVLFNGRITELYWCDKEAFHTITDIVDTAFAEGSPNFTFVCPLPTKSGVKKWIQGKGTFTDERINGVPVIFSVFTDVTDIVQMRTEQSVTYENLPGFVAKFQVRKDGAGERVVFLNGNDKFHRFFGGIPDAPGTFGLTNVDNQSNRKALEEHYPRMRAGEAVSFILQAESLSCKKAWFQLNAACVDRLEGNPVYLIIYIDITDITEQRSLREKLEKALETAKQASQAKSDFLARMSHDIRTPMNAILGMLLLARQSWDKPDRIKDYLNIAENSANFLLSLINDILDMSKIESGKMVLKLEPFDLCAMLRDIVVMFHSFTKEKNLQFEISMARDLGEIYLGDKLKLNRILMNLFGNAIKFTDPGGTVSLAVTVGARNGDETEFFFAVKDTGRGMEPSLVDKLFKPFEQNTRQSDNDVGSGLGLAIADNYARLMGGQIHVESELGSGSTFTAHVWMQAVETEEAPADNACFDALRAVVTHPDPRSCDHVCSLFEKLGVTAASACSAETALAMMEEDGDKPDFVAIDWEEARPEAIELLREMYLRFGEYPPSLIIICYDWSNVDFPLEIGERANIIFLQKPLSSSLLRDFLHSITESPESSQATESSFHGERILLVDDNDINILVATTILEKQNLIVESASDGLEALEMFCKSDPGYYFCILMDIRMPVMGGREATRRIRVMPHKDAQTIPIIALSANAFDDDVRESLKSGMNAHLSKPIDVPTLYSTIQAARANLLPGMMSSENKEANFT